ncbi:MAG: Npt1/Npt2 family nucleotide transporter [Sandaracinaceae bacterium]
MQSPPDRADGRAAFFALIAAGLMIAQQVGSKATRDALFLTSFSAADLPRVVIASAAASMVTVLVATRAYARFGPQRVVPVSFAVSGALFIGEWLAAPSMPDAVAVVLFLHTAVFGALSISGFWSVVNERFDPHTAKRVVGRIGTGATVGGVAGGVLAERVGRLSDANTMLFVLAVLSVLAAIFVVGISRGGAAHVREAAPRGALAILRSSPYLRGLGALVLLTAISASLLDYAFKAEAAAHFESGELLSFFALFHVGAAIASLFFQTALAKPALERLGVAGAAAMLPLAVLITGAIAAFVRGLASAVAARAAELVLANSVFRSGYELLYTPIPPAQKRPTKALIDVAGNRVGDALGSAVVLGVLAFAPDLATNASLGLAAVFAIATLVVARSLHRGYMQQLAESLRSGAPDGASDALLQNATLQTLSTLGLDREALFEQLAAHQSWNERASVSMGDTADSVRPPPAIDVDAPEGDPVHAVARTFRAGDAAAIRTALEAGPLDPRLYEHAIALLARRDVYPAAVAALRQVGDAAAEPLTRAITDPAQSFAVRRRIPRVLSVCDGEVARQGLAAALDDEQFEVRYRSALALARIAARAGDRPVDKDRVNAVVRRELEASRKVWDSRKLLDEEADDSAQGEPKVGVHRSVEHVFTLLSLGYRAEPLRLALYALGGDDSHMRGTALEYLDTVLPDDIKGPLFPMLDARVEIRRRRDQNEIVQDLVRSMQALDAGELRDAIAKAAERSGSRDSDGA